MTINREHIKQQFYNYTSNYDLTDPKIKLKYDHTYRVAEFCDRIARSLDLAANDIDLAWCLGMFHDVGRFEQVRRYHTFKDSKSVNHAALSADLLFQDGLVKDYILDATQEELDLMEKAVRFHNLYRLPEYLTERELVFSNILRDADKVDILRVNIETPREEIYDLPTEAFVTSDMTDEVFEAVSNQKEVDRQYSKTGIDFLMGHVGFVFGLVYEESKRMVKEQGYLKQILSFESKNPKTQDRLEIVRDAVWAYLDC